MFLCWRASGWPSWAATCALIAGFAADRIAVSSTQSLLVTCLTTCSEVTATDCATASNSAPSLYWYNRVMIRIWVTVSEPQSAVCRRRPAPRGGGLKGGSEGGGLRGGGFVTLLELYVTLLELYDTTVTLQSVVPLHGPSLELCKTSMRVGESEIVCISNWVESLTLISIVALSGSGMASEKAA